MSEQLSTIIFQELREKFPGIDWELGSTVRELVAEPIARIGDTADQYIAEAENRFDIIKMLDDPAQYAETIDALAEKLNITTVDTTVASGTVRILLDSVPDLLVVANGTQFSWNNTILFTSQETRWSLQQRDNTQTPRLVGPSSYVIEVPVESNEQNELALSSGSPVNWLNAPSYVYDCRIGSAVTGGRTSYTLTEKAELIRDILFPPNYNGEVGIKTALRRELPLIVRDVVVGDRPLNRAGTVCLYVQTGRAPEQWSVRGVSQKIGNDVILKVRLPGVYRINEVYNIDTGANARYRYTFDLSDCTIVLTDSVENAPYMIVCEGLKDYAEVQSKLYAEAKNTPYDFVVGTPVFATIGLDLALSSAQAVTNTSPAIIALQRYITSLPINTYLIDDTSIEKVLAPYGITLASPTIYTADISSTSESYQRVASGSINLQDVMYASSTPMIMYCYNDGISVINV